MSVPPAVHTRSRGPRGPRTAAGRRPRTGNPFTSPSETVDGESVGFGGSDRRKDSGGGHKDGVKIDRHHPRNRVIPAQAGTLGVGSQLGARVEHTRPPRAGPGPRGGVPAPGAPLNPRGPRPPPG